MAALKSAPMPAPQVLQPFHCACSARPPLGLGEGDGGVAPAYAAGGVPAAAALGVCVHLELASLYVYQLPFRGGQPRRRTMAAVGSSKSLTRSSGQGTPSEDASRGAG